MKPQTVSIEAPLVTSLPDILEYLRDARQLALNRLIECNNGPHNRLYDHINAAIAIAQQLGDDDD